MSGDTKARRIGVLKELAECANRNYDHLYKRSAYANLPQIKKTPKHKRTTHFPYSADQLKSIFNPHNEFFKNNPHVFWACMIALFTGARSNAAATLQYKSIVTEGGIPCIQFTDDEDIQHLKNDASIRTVPIHKQLLAMGFVDYVNRRKRILKADDNDFIFPECVTTVSGKFNDKFYKKFIQQYLPSIGIVGTDNRLYDFHSFRKVINITMKDEFNIPQSYVDRIIG